MEINDLTPAEERVWRAFPKGEPVDFREGEAEADNPATGADWGPERTIRASVLRALLLRAQQDGEVPRLRLSGARVTGQLNLMYAGVDHPLHLRYCHFDESPDFYGSRLRQLNLRGSVLPSLSLASTRIDGPLRMTDCRVRGPVKLAGSQIAGALFMDGAELTTSDPSVPVLQLHQAVLGDGFAAPGLRVRGEMRLDGATVGGSIALDDADLSNPGGHALCARSLEVRADVRARNLRTQGGIDLRGSRIAGSLDFTRARLSNPGGTALRASSCTIGELWLYRCAPIEGRLHLRRSRIDVLGFESEVAPGEVLFNNLTYTALNPHEPTHRRLPLLERDGDGYVPYAYEQLAAAYRHAGDEGAARRVQLAKLRRHRATLPWLGRTWGHLQDTTVGYGFRPLRAAVWLLSLLAAGSIAFALHHPSPLKADEAPEFNPVFYTLDLLLPVISFGQEGAFAPEDGYQYLSYVLILTGWILATTVIAGVSRSVARQ
ncbi:membrane-associated oxidoreductase [Streptomyces sp. ME02-8801-2C]|uniref:membrane-associated oxidoreductase n=1 Tax=Streptomyces sp. ME02-8801-2C TaxID=3028680 RepID=UPI0029B06E77|nr:membrane-associated oxidoreductase [Streptomyces sp. ME02-8801-2C]MDX3451479.1 membrane-associated oxidoreductase [Streptomyces sp. ME02-8801-2C]